MAQGSAQASAATIYVLNGPNLNMLGIREPEKYGHASLADVEKLCVETAAQFGLKADCRQSNREGELIDFIHEAHGNLHSDWDDVPSSLRHGGLADLVTAARAEPTTSGPVEGWAVKWASDSVVKAHDAFTGVSFTGAGRHKWDAQFVDEDDYDEREADLKHAQLAKGGARLAQLLNTIWP